MTQKPLATIEQATPTWLTAQLRQAGVLPAGRVTHVQVDSNPAFNSVAAHLELTYSADAPATAPGRLFLKLKQAHWGREETQFYQQLAPGRSTSLPMLLPCYSAAYDPATGRSHCLLLDVSRSHTAPVSRAQLLALEGVPRAEQLAGIIDALAQFHAAWWEADWLGSRLAGLAWWLAGPEGFAKRCQQFADDWAKFQTMASDWLTPAIIDLYEQALAGLSHLWKPYFARRVAQKHQLTLIHGDCYLSQFLCPRDTGRVYLVDFDSIGTNLPADDLVFLLATFWTPEQRNHNQREERLLRRYIAGLEAHGVTNVTWDDLVRDYRLSLLLRVFHPIWDCVNGSSPAYWQPKTHCLTGAYQDWHCAAFIDDSS